MSEQAEDATAPDDCVDDVCELPGAPVDGAATAAIAADLTVEDDPEAFMEFAAERGWGDGLPLIPPTPERVDRALAGLPAQIDPDEIIATLPPRGGLVTRRSLAAEASSRRSALPVAAAAPVVRLRAASMECLRTAFRGIYSKQIKPESPCAIPRRLRSDPLNYALPQAKAEHLAEGP